MNNVVDAKQFAVPEEFVERWDKEHVQYFRQEAIGPHIINPSQLKQTGDVLGKSAAQVFDTTIAEHPIYVYPPKLRIWAPGSAIRDRDVVEVGCGNGYLAKQLTFVVKSYLGIDASRFAICLARGSSAPNCTFAHLNEPEILEQFRETRDSMVGREFFIHQCFDDALQLLALGTYLLRPGGRVYADFFYTTPALPAGSTVHPARGPRDPVHASCGYHYRDDDIHALAQQSGLRIVEEVVSPEQFRRFVVFEKV